MIYRGLLPRIPPRYFLFALTDRDDGSEWALLCDPETERLRIVSPLPKGFNGYVYPKGAGPTLPSRDGVVRFFVRGGRLGFEPYLFKVSSRPIHAPERVRVNFKNVIYSLFFKADKPATRSRPGYRTEAI